MNISFTSDNYYNEKEIDNVQMLGNLTVFTEAVTRRYSLKKTFLEISQNSLGNTCARVSFLIKLLASACNFIKKETLAQAFSCEFCESSKNTFSHRTPLVEKCRRKKRNRPTLWNLLKVTKNETKSKFVYLDSNLFKHIPHLKVLILLWQNLYHYF